MYRSKPVGPSTDHVIKKEATLRADPSMTFYQENPCNVGAPPEIVRQTFLTPQERFFVRNHAGVPEVDLQHCRLAVTGMVHTPLQLSLDELRQDFDVS